MPTPIDDPDVVSDEATRIYMTSSNQVDNNTPIDSPTLDYLLVSSLATSRTTMAPNITDDDYAEFSDKDDSASGSEHQDTRYNLAEGTYSRAINVDDDFETTDHEVGAMKPTSLAEKVGLTPQDVLDHKAYDAFNSGFLSDAESNTSAEAYECVSTKHTQAQHYDNIDCEGSDDAYQQYEDDLRPTETTFDTGVPSLHAAAQANRPAARGRRTVTLELDEVDKTIFDLKSSGYGEKHIADVVLQAYGLKYDSKSILTRYRRICQVKMNETDRLLDKYKKSWTHEEDDALMTAYEAAQGKISAEIQAIRLRIFHKTAVELRKQLPEVFYSPAACKERYNKIMRGEAFNNLMELPSEQRIIEAYTRFEHLTLKAVEEQQRKEIQAQLAIVHTLSESVKERRLRNTNDKPHKSRKRVKFYHG